VLAWHRHNSCFKLQLSKYNLNLGFFEGFKFSTFTQFYQLGKKNWLKASFIVGKTLRWDKYLLLKNTLSPKLYIICHKKCVNKNFPIMLLGKNKLSSSTTNRVKLAFCEKREKFETNLKNIFPRQNNMMD